MEELLWHMHHCSCTTIVILIELNSSIIQQGLCVFVCKSLRTANNCSAKLSSVVGTCKTACRVGWASAILLSLLLLSLMTADQHGMSQV